MGNWMILVEHPLDELKYFGGFLTKLKVILHNENRELAIHERPYILYYSAADIETENKQYVSYQDMMHSILEVSKFLGFNYRVLYQGRYSYNNTTFDVDFYNKLTNEIKLVRPKFIFVSCAKKFASVVEFIETKFPEINILFAGEHLTGNYCNILKRDAFEYNDVDQLYKAYTLYGKIMQEAPSYNSWEYKYYTLATHGVRFKKDFVEIYNTSYFIDGRSLYDFTKLEFKPPVNEKLILEELL